jgi:chromosome segregation ATPase
MSTLYELSDLYAALYDAAIEDSVDGEITDEFAKALNAIDQELDAKLVGCAQVYHSIKAQAAALEAEASRLSSRASSLNKSIDRLKGYIKQCLDDIGEKKRQAGIFKFSVQKNGQPSIEIKDDSQIPTEFDLPVERKIDKRKILEAHKAGITPLGVEIRYGEHLRIT